MQEIRIPELFILLFLLFFLLRPLVKGLWPLEGLSWLPLLSLAVTLGLYPAYGFRPETLPLLLLGVFLNIINIPALSASLHARSGDLFHDRGPFFTGTALALLAAAGVFALGFSPRIPPELTADGVDTHTIRDEARNRDYFLRVYRPSGESGSLPLLFVVPPEPGSGVAVDRICAGLRDQGFRVISYSRRGLDFPAAGEGGRKYWPSPLALRDCWAAFRRGWKYQKANAKGRAREAGRREDIAFLLPRILKNQGPGGIPLFPAGKPPVAHIRELPGLPEPREPADPGGETGTPYPGTSAAGPARAGTAYRERETAGVPLVLIGYGSGGGALVSLADSPDFAPLAAPVKGIIAVEAGLWHAYEGEERQPPGIPEGWFSRVRAGIRNGLIRLKPRKVRVSRAIPRPAVPVLYLLSDRAFEPGAGESRYGVLYEILRNSPGPAAIACLEGAGPLDYTAAPLIWPVYAALFPGAVKTGREPDLTGTTVRLLGGFSALAGEARFPGGTAGPDAAFNAGPAIPGLRVEGNAEFRAWFPALCYASRIKSPQSAD
jgi:hypothetical protein